MEEKGMLLQALAEFETCVRLSQGGPLYLASLAEVQARLGNRDEVLRILSQLQTPGEKYVSPSSMALIHASLGDLDESFAWNERAFQDRDASLVWLQVAPESDSVRSDPRFADLLHRMNFPNS